MANETTTTIADIQSHLNQLAAALPALKDKTHPAGELWSEVLQELDNLAQNINHQETAERKQIESERDRFFTQSLNLLGVAGFDGYFKRLNPAWESTLGFSRDKLMAEPFMNLVHPDDHAATLFEVQKLAAGGATISFENRCRCQDGSYKWMLWNATPFLDQQSFYATGHDITERKAQEAEREQLITEMAALYKSSQAMASARSGRQIFDILFEQIRRQNPCEISILRFRLVDNEPISAELTVNWQRRNNPSYPEGTRFSLPETPQARLLTTKEPLYIDDIATDNRLSAAERESFAPTAACSVAVLPLATSGQSLGTIMVYFTRPHTFTEATKRLWLSLTEQAAVSLINYELIQEAAYHVAQMETAAEVAKAASSILDLQDLLNTAVTLIRDRFKLYYVGAFLLDEVREWAVLRAGTGEAGHRQLKKGHRLKIGGESMIGWSIHHREPRIALDVGQDAVHFQNPDLPDTRSEMALPLVSRDEVIGALTIQSVEEAAFSREDIVFLKIMADQLANAIQNARLFEQTQREIAERKRIEEALRVSEKRFALAMRGTSDGLWDWDIVNNTLYWSPRLKELLGYADDELQVDFDTLVELLHPDDRPTTQAAIDAHLKERGHYAVEQRLRTKSGEYRWFVARGQAIWDEQGNPLRMAGSSSDITERKQAEAERERLLAEVQRLAAIVENHPDFIGVGTLEGKALYVNPAGLKMMGLPPDQDVTGMDATNFYPPADVARLLNEGIPTALQKGSWSAETNLLKVDGTTMPVEETVGINYDIQGNPVSFSITMHDITERKQAEEALRQSEERFRSIYNKTPVMLHSIDQEGRLVSVSDYWLETLGYERHEVLGRKSYEFYTESSRHYATEVGIPEFLKTGISKDIPYQIVKKNGEVIDALLSGLAKWNEEGELEYSLTVIVDVTELRRTVETLQLTQFSVDHSPEAICWLTPTGQMIYANEGMSRSLGYSGKELLSRSIHDIAPNFPTEARTERWQELKQQGSIVFETEFQAKDGATIPIEARINYLEFNGKEYNFVFARDITERKQAEQTRQEALTRTQLLYNISDALATLTDRQAALETLLGEYLLLLDVNRGGVSLFDQARHYNRVQALYVDNKVVASNLAFPFDEDLLAQHLIEHPFPLVIEDVSQHPLTKHNRQIRGHIESMLAIPLTTRGIVVGILGADATEKGHVFSQQDIEMGKAIADQLIIWLENRQLLDEAQHRSNLLQTASEVSKAANSILDADQLIETSVKFIRDQFDFYYVGLFLIDNAHEWAVLRAGTGEAGRIQLEKGHRLKIGGESMIGWCVQHRQARIALDVGKDAVRFQNPDLPDTHSEMALPLISRDQVIGALTVQSVEPDAFSAEDITVLQTMADQLANAIANARLFEGVARAQKTAEALLQETQALQQLSQALSGTLEVQEILSLFFQACTQDIGFDYVQFWLVDKYQHQIKVFAGVGLPESRVKQASRSLDSDDIVSYIIKTGQTEIIAGRDDRFDTETLVAEDQDNWLRVFTPITLRQENIGLVEAGFHKNNRVTIEDSQLRLLRAFIDQTALALENAQRYETSQRTARREALIKEIIAKVRASTDLDTILQTAVKEVGDALNSKRSYVHLIPPANGEAKRSEEKI